MSSTTSGWAKLRQRLDSVKKPIGTLHLCDDPDIRDRYQQAKRASEQANAYLKALPADADSEARSAMQKQVKDADAELNAAKEAYEAHTITLRFTALAREDLEALLAAHPPTEQDEADGADFAEKTFGPALISAASLDGMPPEDAERYLNTWTPSDARALWQAAWSIQHAQRTDLGKG